ncbi:MAG: hypothetical protein H0T89_25270 [Deltaproteobacteria bacterium]|nr:hypothetical protein [Deltaproteobacteria bacterium]MDQ3297651.1 hypothetical protein [Myxococcota bacterium]
MKLITSIITLGFALGLAACSNESTSTPQTTAPTGQTSSSAPIALPAGMTRVADPTQVCMVNNQNMNKPQIPIEVAGRTYYGCCAMCKDRLGNDPSSRVARDPVTGEQVDKSMAVIIQDTTGKVLYFASEDTLRRFRG